MSPGLYYCPAKASFGEVPPDDAEVVRAFLKTDDFLLTSPNLYNSLGVRTTQLYNKQIVYNHKRHGNFTLGGKVFDFRLKHKFPQKLSKEFLFVDLLNNLGDITEDRQEVLQLVREKALEQRSSIGQFIDSYGGERTKKLFNRWVNRRSMTYAV
jgi:dissimilatory sulfite reductase (desulfoviridin) alpha/beta subunit